MQGSKGVLDYYPDGDGVFTGSTPPNLVPAGDTQPALIVQGTGTRESQVVGLYPGDPTTTLKDFGEVTFEAGTTLSANVSFEDGNGGSDNGDSNNGGGIRGFLPSTGGGMALAVLGAGVLLISGGLLVHRLTR